MEREEDVNDLLKVQNKDTIKLFEGVMNKALYNQIVNYGKHNKRKAPWQEEK